MVFCLSLLARKLAAVAGRRWPRAKFGFELARAFRCVADHLFTLRRDSARRFVPLDGLVAEENEASLGNEP